MEIGRKRRGLDVEVHGAEEETADVAQCHPGGIGLAVGAVACDVRGGDEGLAEEFLIDVGLVLPGVYDGLADGSDTHGPEQRLLIDDASACGIDEDAAMKPLEEGVVQQVPGGVVALTGQRCVECDDVGLLLDAFQRAPFIAFWRGVAGLLAGRVAKENPAKAKRGTGQPFGHRT